MIFIVLRKYSKGLYECTTVDMFDVLTTFEIVVGAEIVEMKGESVSELGDLNSVIYFIGTNEA